MKRVTLTASEVINKVKVVQGTQENFPIPETVDEVVHMTDLDDGCDEAEIVSCFNYGWRVKSQAKLRGAKTKVEDTPQVKAFKALSPAKQAEIMAASKSA